MIKYWIREKDIVGVTTAVMERRSRHCMLVLIVGVTMARMDQPG